MEIYAGEKYKINRNDGEEVTVLYADAGDCLLLRESGNIIKAKGFYTKGNLIFWNAGSYGHHSMFEKIMELM